MIALYLTNHEFAYEVQALIKAFYPYEPIRLYPQDVCPEGETEGIRIFVRAGKEVIGFSFSEQGGASASEEQPVAAGSRRGYKNALKHLIYVHLSRITGKTLPWGTLTGVRPVKLFLELLEEGMPGESVREHMRRHYDCSVEKSDLGLKIAEKELALLKQADYKNGYSVYIGIPFCPTTCLYCSFASYSLKQYGDYTGPYLDALFREIDYAAGALPGKKLTTVYVGGGTPTALDEKELERLLNKIRSTLDFTFVKEFTVEAGRPDSITRGKLELLRAYGATRISVNPQSMNQKTLDAIGRRHTVEQVRAAFYLARETGHDNINMDLIAGLPGETLEMAAHTFDEIGRLRPESVTIHSLAIKRAAALKLQLDKYADIESSDVGAMVSMGESFALSHGYEPYYLYRQKNTTGSKMTSRENVGYARPGREGLYNILIMEEKQTILALGAGATSKFVFHDCGRLERVENVKFVKDYVERADEMIQRKRSFIEREVYGTDESNFNGGAGDSERGQGGSEGCR